MWHFYRNIGSDRKKYLIFEISLIRNQKEFKNTIKSYTVSNRFKIIFFNAD